MRQHCALVYHCDTRFVCKGKAGSNGILPTVVADTTTASRLSSVWVGTAKSLIGGANYSSVKVTMSTGFGVNDTVIVSTVTLQNLLSTPLYNVSWMRNMDPNQEEVSGSRQRVSLSATSPDNACLS